MTDMIHVFKICIGFYVAIILFTAVLLILLLTSNGICVDLSKNMQSIALSDFIWPTPNFTKISSYFGRRNSPTNGASSNHQGVDILAYQGTNVLSTGNGIVTFAGFSDSGGYMVKIKHENDFVSAYCHLGELLLVRVGDEVEQGQIIGSVGPTYLSNGKRNGATTGVHLHFAIYKNGIAVDPLRYFNL